MSQEKEEIVQIGHKDWGWRFLTWLAPGLPSTEEEKSVGKKQPEFDNRFGSFFYDYFGCFFRRESKEELVIGGSRIRTQSGLKFLLTGRRSFMCLLLTLLVVFVGQPDKSMFANHAIYLFSIFIVGFFTAGAIAVSDRLKTQYNYHEYGAEDCWYASIVSVFLSVFSLFGWVLVLLGVFEAPFFKITVVNFLVDFFFYFVLFLSLFSFWHTARSVCAFAFFIHQEQEFISKNGVESPVGLSCDNFVLLKKGVVDVRSTGDGFTASGEGKKIQGVMEIINGGFRLGVYGEEGKTPDCWSGDFVCDKKRNLYCLIRVSYWRTSGSVMYFDVKHVGKIN